MRIPIDISKITDSPYSSENSDSFQFENESTINDLRAELNSGNPTTFLVSGYRGVGKTSYVNKVVEGLDDQSLVVRVSLASFTSYSGLIKKIIRKLFSEYSALDDSSKLDDLQFNKDFKLLHRRTFENIQFTVSSEKTTTVSTAQSLELSAKKLAPFVFTALTSLNGALNWTQYPVVNYIVVLASVIWSTVEVFNWKKSRKVESNDSDKEESKTLYDDEIAEHRLFEIIIELSKEKKCIIIFDELDKIQDINRVSEILEKLKGLMLSGLITSIVIGGQDLYYQVVKAKTNDDLVLNSLFSRLIHVPLPDQSRLRSYFLNLISDESKKREPTLSEYIDELVLRTAGNPRKFASGIRGDLTWDRNRNPYISVSDDTGQYLSYDQELLYTLNEIKKNTVPQLSLGDQAKQDFYVSQLFIWIERMNKFLHRRFTLDEILVREDYDSEKYPASYLNRLHYLLDSLLREMVSQEFLLRDTEHDYESEENINYYFWHSERGDERFNEDFADDYTLNQFTLDVNGLYEVAQQVYLNLVDREHNFESNPRNLEEVLTALINENTLSSYWWNNRMIRSLTIAYNEFVNTNKPEDFKVSFNPLDIGRIRNELIEGYVFAVLSSIENLELSRDREYGFDFIGKLETINIGIEVTYVPNRPLRSTILKEFSEKINNLKKTNKNQSFGLLFIISDERHNAIISILDEYEVVQESNEDFFREGKHYYGALSDAEFDEIHSFAEQSISDFVIRSKKPVNFKTVEMEGIKDLAFDPVSIDYFMSNATIFLIIEEELSAGRDYNKDKTIDINKLLLILQTLDIKNTTELVEVMIEYKQGLISFGNKYLGESAKMNKGTSIYLLGFYLSALSGSHREIINYTNKVNEEGDHSQLATKILIDMPY